MGKDANMTDFYKSELGRKNNRYIRFEGLLETDPISQLNNAPKLAADYAKIIVCLNYPYSCIASHLHFVPFKTALFYSLPIPKHLVKQKTLPKGSRV